MSYTQPRRHMNRALFFSVRSIVTRFKVIISVSGKTAARILCICDITIVYRRLYRECPITTTRDHTYMAHYYSFSLSFFFYLCHSHCIHIILEKIGMFRCTHTRREFPPIACSYCIIVFSLDMIGSWLKRCTMTVT